MVSVASGLGGGIKATIQSLRWSLDKQVPILAKLPAPIAGAPPALDLTVSVSGLVATITCTGGTPNGPATIYTCPAEAISDECSADDSFSFDSSGTLNAQLTAPNPAQTYELVEDTTTGEQSNWASADFT